MKALKLIYKLPLLALLLGMNFNLIAQQFKVLDQYTNLPIISLTYQYGPEIGISNDDGIIRLKAIIDENIYLSHLNYGKWELTPDQLRKALTLGYINRAELAFNLQPITVISLKMTDEKDKKILISDQERLHHDAGAVLNLNPIINGIRKSGAFAFDPVMRGFKYEQLNIVIDGIHSANAACPNRMDPPTSQVSLNRIRQVEILKGPHALRYGIGLGGTINYIQESPSFSSQNRVNGRFSTMYESNGHILRNEGRVGFSGKHHDIGILGSWSKGSDYTDGDGNIIPANFMRGTLGLFGDFRLSSADLLQVTLNRNFARDVDFPTLGMDLRSDDTWMGSIKHTRTFQNRALQRVITSGYFTVVDHLMDNLLRDLNPRMMNASTPANTQSLGGRIEGQWRMGKGKLFAGVDYRTEAAQGVRQREFLMGPMAGRTLLDNAWQDSQIQKMGSFGTYTVPLGAYVFSAAARIDLNHAKANDVVEEFENTTSTNAVTQLNPGVSIGLKRDFAKYFNFGVWAARVQRSGSITERYINYFPVGVDPFEMLGNPDLKAETNNQLDMALGFEKGKFQLEFSPFIAFLTDYITAEKTNLAPRIASAPGVRRFVNVDQALKTGFELTGSQYLAYGFQHQLSLAYTYGQNLSLSEALPEIAPMDIRYTLMGNHLGNKLHTALRIRHVRGQERVSENFGEMTTPQFTLIDADASYSVSFHIAIKIGGQNLLNQAYYEHLNRPIGVDRRPLFSPGRNIFVMLNFKFP
jgi:iron complex outermembrane recepter protein